MSILDCFILFSFLLFSFVQGLRSSKEILTLNTFALGKRSFSIFALTSTIIATYASGSSFIVNLSETYYSGWQYIIPTIGMVISSVFMIVYIIPHCSKIIGKTSVAQVMAEQYGYGIGKITAITGIIGSTASIAVQIKLFSILGDAFFIQYSWYNTHVFSALITVLIIIYCMTGGISSVVRTDIIQFIALSLAIFIITGSLIIKKQTSVDINHYSLEHFNISHILDLSSTNIADMVLITFYFIFPSLSPASFQRLSMGLNVNHLRTSWTYSSIILQILVWSTCFIAYLLYCTNGPKDYNNILSTLIHQCDFIGLKGILLVGILSMLMSTADSYLNIASVLFANDLLKTNKTDYEKLKLAQYSTVIIGIFAFISTFFSKTLLETVFILKAFYIPVVTIPLLAYIFDYKIPVPCVIASMVCGFGFVVMCWIIGTSFKPIMPGMFVNLFVLTTSTLFYKWRYRINIRVQN